MANSLVGIFKRLGKLGELKTQNKENLVSSINEVSDKTKDIDKVKEKVDTSVQKVEAGLNYNTIKITKNDGTTENVLIKIQGGGGGSSLNVFKSSQNGGSFVATEVTNTFTIEGLDSTKDVDLIYNNLFLIQGADYTLDKATGVVGLAFDIQVDEVIYYIITNTSYNYNDLDGLPDLSEKADKSTALIYKGELRDTDLTTITEQGWYALRGGNTNGGDFDYCIMKVFVTTDGGYKYVIQEFQDMNTDATLKGYRSLYWDGTKWSIGQVSKNATKDVTDNLINVVGANGLTANHGMDDANNLPLGHCVGDSLKNAPDVGWLEYHTSNWFSKDNPYRVQTAKNGNGETWSRAGFPPNSWTKWIKTATTDNTVQITEVIQDADAHALYETGIYKGSFKIDTIPSGLADGQGVLEVVKYSGEANSTWLRQTFSSAHDMGTLYIRYKTNATWSVWKEVATTTKIANLTLENGWVASWTGVEPIISRSGNHVTITGIVKGGTTDFGTIIAYIPNDCRPTKEQVFILHNWGATKRYAIAIRTDGGLIVGWNELLPWDVDNVVIQITYSL